MQKQAIDGVAAGRTEYEAAFTHGAASTALQTVGDTVFAILPEGYRTEDLDLEQFLPAPRRVKSDVGLDDGPSFVAYVNRFKTAGALLLANRDAASVTALLDYHEAADKPSWLTHRAVLTVKKTPEWVTWIGKNKQWIGQGDFADFLEDNVLDIAEPDGATILEAASNLQARKTVHFKSGINLSNTTTQLEFVETLEGTSAVGQMEVPTRFTLGLAPFVGMEPIAIPARLRYRIVDHKLSFMFIIERHGRILEKAFDAVLTMIADQTDIKPLLGSVR